MLQYIDIDINAQHNGFTLLSLMLDSPTASPEKASILFRRSPKPNLITTDQTQKISDNSPILLPIKKDNINLFTQLLDLIAKAQYDAKQLNSALIIALQYSIEHKQWSFVEAILEHFTITDHAQIPFAERIEEYILIELIRNNQIRALKLLNNSKIFSEKSLLTFSGNCPIITYAVNATTNPDTLAVILQMPTIATQLQTRIGGSSAQSSGITALELATDKQQWSTCDTLLQAGALATPRAITYFILYNQSNLLTKALKSISLDTDDTKLQISTFGYTTNAIGQLPQTQILLIPDPIAFATAWSSTTPETFAILLNALSTNHSVRQDGSPILNIAIDQKQWGKIKFILQKCQIDLQNLQKSLLKILLLKIKNNANTPPDKQLSTVLTDIENLILTKFTNKPLSIFKLLKEKVEEKIKALFGQIDQVSMQNFTSFSSTIDSELTKAAPHTQPLNLTILTNCLTTLNSYLYQLNQTNNNALLETIMAELKAYLGEQRIKQQPLKLTKYDILIPLHIMRPTIAPATNASTPTNPSTSMSSSSSTSISSEAPVFAPTQIIGQNVTLSHKSKSGTPTTPIQNQPSNSSSSSTSDVLTSLQCVQQMNTQLIASSPTDFLVTKQNMRKKAQEPKCFEFKLTVIEELRTYHKDHPDSTSTAQILSLLQEIYFIPDNPDVFITNMGLWIKVNTFTNTNGISSELKTTCTRIVEILQSQFTSLFIQSNGDLTKTYSVGNITLTILEYLAIHRGWNMLRAIAEKYKPTKDDPTGFGKALLIAISNEKSPCPTNIYKLLIQEHTSLNVRDSQGFTVIHHAIKKKDAELLQLILDQKNIAQILSDCTKPTTSNEAETIIHFCIIQDRIDELNKIIDKLKELDKASLQKILQTKMNYKGEKYTPIELAAVLGKWKMVRKIAKKCGPDAEDTEGFGNAVIMAAKANIRGDIYPKLIKDNTSLKRTDNDGNTALHYAISTKNHQLFQLILALPNFAEILSCCINPSTQESILHFCIIHNFLDNLKEFIKELIIKSKNILQESLRTKTNYNGKKYTPIELAAALGKWDLIATIAENCEPTLGDSEGFGNAFLIALNAKKPPCPFSIYKSLLKKYTSLTVHDNDGLTAIQYAIKNGDDTLFELLFAQLDLGNSEEILSACSNPQKPDETIIHFCVQYGSPQILQKIIDKNKNFAQKCLSKPMVISQTSISATTCTPLQLAATNGRWEMVRIIARNYDPTSSDQERFGSALLAAAQANIQEQDIYSNLIKDSTSVPRDDIGSALNHAIKNGNYILFTLLIKNKNLAQRLLTYIDQITSETVLHFCINNGSVDMLKQIIETLNEIDNQALQKILQTKMTYFGKKYTPIELAAEKCKWDMVNTIAKTCSPTPHDPEGFGNVMLNIAKKRVGFITDREKEAFKLLIKTHTNFLSTDADGFFSITHYLALNNNLELIKILFEQAQLKLSYIITDRTITPLSPLILAISSGLVENATLKCLLNYADINAQHNGSSALSFAVELAEKKLAKPEKITTLLQHSPKPDLIIITPTQTISDKSPLLLPIIKDNVTLFTTLLDLAIKTQYDTNNLNTALIIALHYCVKNSIPRPKWSKLTFIEIILSKFTIDDYSKPTATAINIENYINEIITGLITTNQTDALKMLSKNKVFNGKYLATNGHPLITSAFQTSVNSYTLAVVLQMPTITKQLQTLSGTPPTTPIVQACKENKWSIVQQIAQEHASSINDPEDYKTALELAAGNQQWPTCSSLLQAKAPISNKTILYLILYNQLTILAQIFNKSGCIDANSTTLQIKDKYTYSAAMGQTPKELETLLTNNPDIIEIAAAWNNTTTQTFAILLNALSNNHNIKKDGAHILDIAITQQQWEKITLIIKSCQIKPQDLHKALLKILQLIENAKKTKPLNQQLLVALTNIKTTILQSFTNEYLDFFKALKEKVEAKITTLPIQDDKPNAGNFKQFSTAIEVELSKCAPNSTPLNMEALVNCLKALTDYMIKLDSHRVTAAHKKNNTELLATLMDEIRLYFGSSLSEKQLMALTVDNIIMQPSIMLHATTTSTANTTTSAITLSSSQTSSSSSTSSSSPITSSKTGFFKPPTQITEQNAPFCFNQWPIDKFGSIATNSNIKLYVYSKVREITCLFGLTSLTSKLIMDGKPIFFTANDTALDLQTFKECAITASRNIAYTIKDMFENSRSTLDNKSQILSKQFSTNHIVNFPIKLQDHVLWLTFAKCQQGNYLIISNANADLKMESLPAGSSFFKIPSEITDISPYIEKLIANQGNQTTMLTLLKELGFDDKQKPPYSMSTQNTTKDDSLFGLPHLMQALHTVAFVSSFMPIDFLSTGNNSTTSSQNRQTEFDALDKFFREEIDKCLQDTKQKNISWLEENRMKLMACGIDEQSYVDLLKECRSKMQQTTQTAQLQH